LNEIEDLNRDELSTMKIVRSDGKLFSEEVTCKALHIFELFASKLEMLGKSGLGTSESNPSINSFYDMVCAEELMDLDSKKRAEISLLLDRLKVYFMEYAGERLEDIKADLFFNEEAGSDVMLPLNIVDALSSDIPQSKVQLQTEVARIEWNSKGANIICLNGQFAAEYVICTLPLGVLKANHKDMFNPPLPMRKIEAIESMNPGRISKYLFDWDTPWWIGEDPIIFGDQCSAAEGLFADWIRGISCVRPPEGENALVMCFISGDSSTAADQLADEQVKSDFGEALRFFLRDPSIADPDVLVRECWTTSPYTLGAYSSPGPNSHVETFDDLAATLPSDLNPRVLFAGEATSKFQWSFMHGAFNTGALAASKVIKHIESRGREDP